MANTACSRSLMAGSIDAFVRRRAAGVSGAWYRLLTRAPVRFFSASLNEGWKKFTNNRDAVEARKGVPCRNAFETTVADHAPDDCSVLLLDPRLVILSIRTRACELDLLLRAVREQDLVHELAPVVRVDSPQRERHRFSEPFERVDHQAALANDQGHALRPAAGDVGEDKRVREAPGSGLTAVGDEIHLEEPGDGLLPIGERADRNTLSNTAGSRPSAPLPTRGCRPRLTEHSVKRRRACGQYPRANCVVQLHVPMLLEGGDEDRNERAEALAADPVGGLPQHHHGLANGFVVQARPHPSDRGAGLRRVFLRVQNADRVLAMKARERHELVEDAASFARARSLISLHHRVGEFPSCRCRDRHRTSFGWLRPVANLVRQRPQLGNKSGGATRGE